MADGARAAVAEPVDAEAVGVAVVAARAADVVVRVAADGAARVAAADVTAARVARATERVDVMADVEAIVAAKASACSSKT